MRRPFALPALPMLWLAAALVALSAAAPARAQDGAQYVRQLAVRMVEVSKKATAERRAFYVGMLRDDIDWSVPAIRALGQRYDALKAEEKQKLADWSRDSVLGTGSVMEFLQNLIFQSCAVTGGEREGGRTSMRLSCVRFGSEPNFQVRLDVAPRGGRIKIVDVGYISVSLSEELAKEITKPSAVAEHGVALN